MSDPETWLDRNARELGEALAILRVRLEQVAAGPADGLPPIPSPPALTSLAERLGLSPFEREIVLLGAAMELDTRVPGLCAAAQRDPNRPYPTWALALVLLDQPSWDALSPAHALRRWRLVEMDPAHPGPLTRAPLRVDERVVHYLKGLNEPDSRLGLTLVPFDAPHGQSPEDLGTEQRAAGETIHALWREGAREGELPLVQLAGPDPEARQLIARYASSSAGLHAVRLPVDALPTASHDLDSLARLWQRESRLLPLALFLDAEDLEPGPAERVSVLRRFLAQADGPVILSVREPTDRPGRPAAVVEAHRPTPAQQSAAWRLALGEEEDRSREADRLAAQFDFNLPAIAAIGAACGTDGSLEERAALAWDRGRERAKRRFTDLARRIEPKATWDDLVLPVERVDLLRQVAAQVRHRGLVQEHWGFSRKMNRGLGVSALFAGDSGTGKTMAAEVLANDLRLDLFRVDLSAVVSKYIGETEKNLRRLFDAAEGGGVILFFDEADALFGRRSEVKDSHDRYANVEINYLLQRLEAYRGIAILATNQRSALDEAFVRRLRFIIEFPVPDVALRRSLWERAFPASTESRPGVPLARLDFARLARLNLTGGNIHNIALNAAFRAAAAGTPVTMPLVLAAARDELEKLRRPVNPADFQVNGRTSLIPVTP